MGGIDEFFNGIDKTLGKGESMASRAWTSYSGSKDVTPKSISNAASGTFQGIADVGANLFGTLLKAPGQALFGDSGTYILLGIGGVALIMLFKK
jgi:hypothetical protein